MISVAEKLLTLEQLEAELEAATIAVGDVITILAEEETEKEEPK